MMKYVACMTRGIAVAGASFAVALLLAPAWSAAAVCAVMPAAQPASVARVNGVAVTQAALDASVAVSGRPDSDAVRFDFKQRLIACELLRQAALKGERRDPGQGPSVPLAVSTTGALVCSAREIRPYVLRVVRPAAVTDAEVHARYQALSPAGALPVLGAGRGRCAIGQAAARLRSRMEAERLELAIQALAERLLERADIEQ